MIFPIHLKDNKEKEYYSCSSLTNFNSSGLISSMKRACLLLFVIFAIFGCGDTEKSDRDVDIHESNSSQIVPFQKDSPVVADVNTRLSEKKTNTVMFAGIEMIWVEPGSFQMGSSLTSPVRIMDEKPHNVKITTGFYLGKYEITQRQYALVMENNIADLSNIPSRFSGPGQPVEQVSWKDVQEFCARLTYLERRDQRLRKGWAYCLPTEAEWEYACRAGTSSLYSWGDEIFLQNAVYRESAGRPKQVGQYPANPWGFFDMHGNVWEWVDDWYGGYSSETQKNPEGAETGTSRVLRGGSWANLATNLRSAGRHYLPPNTRSPTTGFRISYKQVQ